MKSWSDFLRSKRKKPTMPKHISRLRYLLMAEATKAQGRMDAFSFALKCNENISVVEAEVQVVRARLEEPVADYPQNAPSATPRIYKDAYLRGLQDAIKMISEMSAQENALSLLRLDETALETA